MNKVFPKPQLTPFEVDYARWCEEQGALLRASRLTELDSENLAEEIESLGRSDKREIISRMEVVLSHLLKWQFQTEARSPSWAASIAGARQSILDLLEESPSLKPYPAAILDRAYRIARARAAAETGLSVKMLPVPCPYTASEAIDLQFYPGDNQPDWIKDF